MSNFSTAKHVSKYLSSKVAIKYTIRGKLRNEWITKEEKISCKV